MHPVLEPDSGIQFPPEADPEAASHSEAGFRDTVSAPNKKAPTHDGAGAKGAAYTVDGKRRRQSAMAVRALLYPR